MATMQKFKFFATQCAVIGSPTRNPTTSPIVHIRRRKTLRMLLGKSAASHGSAFHRRFLHHHYNSRDDAVDNMADDKSPPQRKINQNSDSNSNRIRSKLKDLFVSSPESAAEDGGVAVVVARHGGGDGGGGKPFTATLRKRLLMRRGWRPVLVAIPEAYSPSNSL